MQKKEYEEKFQTIKLSFESYQRALNFLEYQKKDIVNTLLEIKNHQIENESCKCRSCRPRYFDEGWVTENGINLRKDADHPNDIIDKEFTWEEIDKLFMFKHEILTNKMI